MLYHHFLAVSYPIIADVAHIIGAPIPMPMEVHQEGHVLNQFTVARVGPKRRLAAMHSGRERCAPAARERNVPRVFVGTPVVFGVSVDVGAVGMVAAVLAHGGGHGCCFGCLLLRRFRWIDELKARERR